MPKTVNTKGILVLPTDQKKEAADVPARDEICRSSKFDYTRNPTEHLLEIIVHA